MQNEKTAKVQEVADRVIELDEELEAAGQATIDAAGLERKRAALHRWIDELSGVVVNAALGRVSLIHGDGRVSTISSADLPFRLSDPVGPAVSE